MSCLQIQRVVDEPQQRALQIDILGDEQSDEPNHGRSPIPPLGLRIEGSARSAVGRFLVVHGDESGADDDGHHEQEIDQAFALGDLLPHAQARDNLRDEGPGDPEHGQTAVDGLRGRAVELHQALRARIAVFRTPLLLGAEKLLHRGALEDAQRIVFLLGISLRARKGAVLLCENDQAPEIGLRKACTAEFQSSKELALRCDLRHLQ